MPGTQKVEQILEFLSEQYDVDTEMKEGFDVEGWNSTTQDLMEIMNETCISPDDLQKIEALMRNIESHTENFKATVHLYKETWKKYLSLDKKQRKVQEKWLGCDPWDKEGFLEEERLGEECLSLAEKASECNALCLQYSDEMINFRRKRARIIHKLIQIISKVYKITPTTEETLKADESKMYESKMVAEVL